MPEAACLEDVLGVMRILDIPTNQGGQRLFMTAHQLDESALVSRKTSLDEGGISGLLHGIAPPTI